MNRIDTHIKSLLSALILLAAGFFIFAMSMHVTWIGDDVDYRLFINETIWGSWGSIDNLGDLFRSQCNHYMHVNGRAVAHTLVQLFNGLLGKEAFAVSNGLIYMLFVWLLCRVGGLHRPLRHPVTMAGAFAIVIICFVTKMMPTCQIGYIWTGTLTLGWLMAFSSLRQRGGWWRLVLAIVLGLLAGNSQEAFSIGLSAGWGIWWLSRKCRVPAPQFAALAAYWLGTLSDCLAPGAFERIGTVHVTLVYSLQYLLIALRGFYIMIAVAAWQIYRHRTTPRLIYRANAVYINAIIILFAFNLVIGVYCNRQLFGIEMLSLLITLRLLRGHTIAKPWSAVAIVLAASIYITQWSLATNVNRQFEAIEKQLVTNGGGNVYFDRSRPCAHPLISEFRYYEDMVANTWNDVHHSVQKYHLIEHPRLRALQVMPAWYKDHPLDADTVIEYADKHYIVATHIKTHRLILADMQNRLTGSRYTDTLVIGRTVKENDTMHAAVFVPPSNHTRLLGIRLTK